MKEKSKQFGGANVPADLDENLKQSAKELLGVGYIDDYYFEAASAFVWLYQSGYDDAMRAKARKKRSLNAH